MPRLSSREREMGPIIPGERTPPPGYLGDEELAIWGELTEGLSDERIADVGFQILGPLLVAHIWNARELSDQISAMLRADAWSDPKQRQVLRQLMRDQGAQSTMIVALCRALRLTSQSKRYDRADLRTEPVSRPWLDWTHAVARCYRVNAQLQGLQPARDAPPRLPP